MFVDLNGKLFKQKIQTKKKTGNISWHKNNDNILTDYRIYMPGSIKYYT